MPYIYKGRDLEELALPGANRHIWVRNQNWDLVLIYRFAPNNTSTTLDTYMIEAVDTQAGKIIAVAPNGVLDLDKLKRTKDLAFHTYNGAQP